MKATIKLTRLCDVVKGLFDYFWHFWQLKKRKEKKLDTARSFAFFWEWILSWNMLVLYLMADVFFIASSFLYAYRFKENNSRLFYHLS